MKKRFNVKVFIEDGHVWAQVVTRGESHLEMAETEKFTLSQVDNKDFETAVLRKMIDLNGGKGEGLGISARQTAMLTKRGIAVQ